MAVTRTLLINILGQLIILAVMNLLDRRPTEGPGRSLLIFAVEFTFLLMTIRLAGFSKILRRCRPIEGRWGRPLRLTVPLMTRYLFPFNRLTVTRVRVILLILVLVVRVRVRGRSIVWFSFRGRRYRLTRGLALTVILALSYLTLRLTQRLRRLSIRRLTWFLRFLIIVLTLIPWGR